MDIQPRSRASFFLLLLPALVFILALFVYPFIYGMYLSLSYDDGTFTFDNYIRFFTDEWDFNTIGTTLLISLPVTLFNVLAAIPLAYYMRRGVKGEKLITFFLIVPITLGTVLISEGMLSFMGPHGWLNQILMFVGLIQEPIQFTHNY